MTKAPTGQDACVQVAIASDHAGVELKAALAEWLIARGVSLRDLGPQDGQSVDYPDYAKRLGDEVVQGRAQKGVLICGSGVGVSIAVNKVAGVRAALVSEPLSASLARQHNDANVICLGARIVGEAMARACVQAFLDGEFDPGDDGRHQRRVDKIAAVRASSTP
ncbi:ribose-5-phosphate isomerase [Bradymonas sediminis]|nr:ribose 5-phosphate isomerase B [Bradymonas sediminis]TDP64441.1 ribose-5-phosphate isomerase [Bradymonas sediminis]